MSIRKRMVGGLTGGVMHRSNRRMLVVCRDPSDADLVAGLLRLEGYQVTAADAAHARRQLCQGSVSLLVCESAAAAGPGVGLAAWASQNHPRVPILLLDDTAASACALVDPDRLLAQVAGAVPASGPGGAPAGCGARSGERRASELLRELLHAEQRERRRIAAELHDDTLQVITAALLRMDMLRDQLHSAGAADAAPLFAPVRHDLALAMERTRHMLFALYPRDLEELGLNALGQLVERLAEDGGIGWRVEVDTGRHPAVTEQLAYRTVREAVTNTVKHARATAVLVTARDRDGSLRVAVVDDGDGFDTSRVAAAGDPMHLGLHELVSRIEAAGGAARIRSRPGGGTSVRFWLPVGERR